MASIQKTNRIYIYLLVCFLCMALLSGMLQLHQNSRVRALTPPEPLAQVQSPVPLVVAKGEWPTPTPWPTLVIARAAQISRPSADTTPAPGSRPSAGSTPVPGSRPAATQILTTTYGVSVLQVYHKGQMLEMNLEEYVIGVLAGEVPASFEPAALAAQAIAARTRAVWQATGTGCRAHKGADICTSAGCCQHFGNIESAAYRKAVEDTAGLVLEYQGKPIHIYYHSGSATSTEDGKLFGDAQPYLVCVPTFGDTRVRTFNFTFAQLAARVGTGQDALHQQGVSVVSQTESGRVAKLQVGSVTITGEKARTAFGLPGTDFDVTTEGESVTFTVRGGGHGIGLSQYGANAMAKRGDGYAEILLTYFPGTGLARLAQ